MFGGFPFGAFGGMRGGNDDDDDNEGVNLAELLGSRGRGGAARGREQKPKVKPTKKALDITLEDIYNGKVKKLQHSRTRCCEKCGGKGGEGVQKCKPCKGKGIVVQMYQMGPGMYQQVQKHCDKCQGEGQTIAEGGKCKGCDGKKVLEKKKTIEIPLEMGVPNNTPITIPGEGNEIPDALAGDLVLITQEQEHKIFTRKGADLFMKKNVSLLEALTGFEFSLTHLDGHEYTIYMKKGDIISDRSKKVVRGLGMPYYKNNLSHGNLIIEFHVVMPKRGTLTAEQYKQLAEILPGKINPRPKDDKYEMLQDFRKQETNTSEQGGHKNDEEEELEEEEEAGGNGCRAQ